MKIGTWLLSLAQPLIARIMIALGFSVVSIVGVTEVFQQLKQQVTANFGGMPADMLNLFLLAGGGTAMGMVVGAIATRLLLWQIQKATQFIGKAPT